MSRRPAGALQQHPSSSDTLSASLSRTDSPPRRRGLSARLLTIGNHYREPARGGEQWSHPIAVSDTPFLARFAKVVRGERSRDTRFTQVQAETTDDR